MANMSYCRFENTLSDLRDCKYALQESENGEGDDLSQTEMRARKELIALCAKIAANFGDE